MSVERIERKDGSVVWRVRWRQGGRNRSKVLGRRRDAEAFDAELRRKKRTGELAALDAGKETLAEFGEEWWRLYAEPNLAAMTLQVYAVLWDAHVLPRLGSFQLRELTPAVISRFRLQLEADGAGRVSIAKAMTLLQGVLQRACEWDRLSRTLPVRCASRAPPETERAQSRVHPAREPRGRRAGQSDRPLQVARHAGRRQMRHEQSVIFDTKRQHPRSVEESACLSAERRACGPPALVRGPRGVPICASLRTRTPALSSRRRNSCEVTPRGESVDDERLGAPLPGRELFSASERVRHW